MKLSTKGNLLGQNCLNADEEPPAAQTALILNPKSLSNRRRAKYAQTHTPWSPIKSKGTRPDLDEDLLSPPTAVMYLCHLSCCFPLMKNSFFPM